MLLSRRRKMTWRTAVHYGCFRLGISRERLAIVRSGTTRRIGSASRHAFPWLLRLACLQGTPGYSALARRRQGRRRKGPVLRCSKAAADVTSKGNALAIYCALLARRKRMGERVRGSDFSLALAPSAPAQGRRGDYAPGRRRPEDHRRCRCSKAAFHVTAARDVTARSGWTAARGEDCAERGGWLVAIEPASRWAGTLLVIKTTSWTGRALAHELELRNNGTCSQRDSRRGQLLAIKTALDGQRPCSRRGLRRRGGVSARDNDWRGEGGGREAVIRHKQRKSRQVVPEPGCLAAA